MEMGHLFDVTVMGPCEAVLKEPTRGVKTDPSDKWRRLKPTHELSSSSQRSNEDLILARKKKRGAEDLPHRKLKRPFGTLKSTGNEVKEESVVAAQQAH